MLHCSKGIMLADRLGGEEERSACVDMTSTSSPSSSTCWSSIVCKSNITSCIEYFVQILIRINDQEALKLTNIYPRSLQYHVIPAVEDMDRLNPGPYVRDLLITEIIPSSVPRKQTYVQEI